MNQVNTEEIMNMIKHTWKNAYGYNLPVGDLIWTCPNCNGARHVHGIETYNPQEYCVECGQRNYYPWEFNKRSRHNES